MTELPVNQSTAKPQEASGPALTIFDGLPDPMRAATVAFNNGRYCGFEIHWAKKGIGWGGITLCMDKETGEWHIDMECMGPEFVAEVFRALTDGKEQLRLVGIANV